MQVLWELLEGEDHSRILSAHEMAPSPAGRQRSGDQQASLTESLTKGWKGVESVLAVKGRGCSSSCPQQEAGEGLRQLLQVRT